MDEQRSTVRLEPEKGPAIVLTAAAQDGYSLRFAVPADMKPGHYIVRVHNGGGGGIWSLAGTIAIVPVPKIPSEVFSVLETYGPDATRAMRNSLVKYNLPLDRTEGIQAALAKAKANGGGTIYFPAGRYTIKGPLVDSRPYGAQGRSGMGLVTLRGGARGISISTAVDRKAAPRPKGPSRRMCSSSARIMGSKN